MSYMHCSNGIQYHLIKENCIDCIGYITVSYWLQEARGIYDEDISYIFRSSFACHLLIELYATTPPTIIEITTIIKTKPQNCRVLKWQKRLLSFDTEFPRSCRWVSVLRVCDGILLRLISSHPESLPMLWWVIYAWSLIISLDGWMQVVMVRAIKVKVCW